jgi:DNA-binding transcriptional LysR family regulator
MHVPAKVYINVFGMPSFEKVNVMRLDLTTLRLFLTVIEERNMARAAEREHISAPAVTKRISDLEATLGVTLIERQSTGVRPTAAGAALAVEARELMRGVDRMVGKLSEYAQGQRGEVKILCSASGLVGALPEDLKAFMLAHPRVAVSLEERHAAQVLKGIAEGEADIGVFAYHAAAKSLSITQDLSVDRYQTLRLGIVTSRQHPLSRRTRISFAEATEYEFVGCSQTSVVGALIGEITRSQGLEYRNSLIVTGFEAVRRMVQADLGIGVLPEYYARPYVAGMLLEYIPLEDDWAWYQIDVCTKATDTLPMAVRLMRAHLMHGGGNALRSVTADAAGGVARRP